MDDTLKVITLGVVSLLLLNGGIEQRARRGAEQQARMGFEESGEVRAHITPHGAFGVALGDLTAVDIYASHVRADKLPFFVYPRLGNTWKGRLHHIRLHLTDITLAGIPVRKYEADIPSNTFDLSHAIFHNRLVLRSAGSGPASVTIGSEGLKIFIERKYRTFVSGIDIHFKDKRVYIEGLGGLTEPKGKMQGSGRLVARLGRYLDLVDTDFKLNGTPAPFISSLINPVLDSYKDLGLGGYFYMERAEIEGDTIVVYGRSSFPTYGETTR